MKTIFVSSTFKDMHYERDAIREITAPALNSVAREYGDELDFCDLRWGINTGDLDTEEGSKKVLDVCLDEIDRCEPPMVVLLGYRYGWIPEADLIKSAADRKMLELEDLERSVTALEIEYGALCDDKKFKNTLFYFREIEGDVPSDYLAEDDEHAEKIAALKNRIQDMTGGRIEEYTLTWNDESKSFDGIKEFADKLAKDIKARLIDEWKKAKSLTPFQRERRTHETFIREKNIMFRARQGEAEKLIKDALSQPVTIIKGEVGSGKSTLFSHMATELGKTEWTVLPFISGLTPESNSASDIIESTVYFIEEELYPELRTDRKDSQTSKIRHYIDETDSLMSDISLDIDGADFRINQKKKHTPDEWREKLTEMCSVYAKTGKKLLIMLDAADQLTQNEERDKLRFIPTSVSENIHFVMTCTTDFKTPGREYYTLQELYDEDRRDVISGILARSGKELSKAVINKMLRLKASDNPLYLSLLVQRLLMMNNEDFEDIRYKGDGMAAIEQHQLELIEKECPDALDEMSAALIKETGKRINEKLVSKAAEYLAISRNGLRRKDLAALLGEEWTEVDFSHFVNYMNDCFMLRDDGRYDFMHKSIRAGFYRQCENLNGVEAINREIFEYFKSLENGDSIRMREIIYHTIKANDKSFFIDHIIESMSNDNQLYINLAARDTYAKCIADNGQWMTNILKEAEIYDADEKLKYLCDFCNYELSETFSGNQKELEIKFVISSANVHLAEHLYKKLETYERIRTLSDSYEMIGEVYEAFNSKKNLEMARKMYEKCLEINKQLVRELDTPGSKIYLSRSYYRIARICDRFGDRGNLEQALDLCNKGCKIVEKLASELGTTDSKRELADNYYNVAVICEKLGGSENLERALELYNKALAIRKQLVSELGTTDSKRDLAISYVRIAGIYEKIDGQENLEQALKLYNNSLKICVLLADDPGTAVNKRDLAVSYHNLARIFEKFDGRENLGQALELYHKGLKISALLADELDTVDSKRDLALFYNNVAGIYEKMGGPENLKRALELYHKCLAIRELLADDRDMPDSKKDLASSYNNVAAMYMHLGGSKNLKRALDLCYKDLRISEELANQSKTVEAYNNLIVSMYNIVFHPTPSVSDKKAMLSNIIKTAKMLYEQTGWDIFKTYIADAKKLLQVL